MKLRIALCALVLLASAPASAQVDFFPTFAGIDGEAADAKAQPTGGADFFDGRFLRADDFFREQSVGDGDGFDYYSDLAAGTDATQAPYQGRRSSGGYVPT